MKNKKVWFITGAGRGMGVDFAKAALAAGHAVGCHGPGYERRGKGGRQVGQPAGRYVGHERSKRE
jgi:NAD(P)-dependent dehydrogenase (short-subunit alcohol dehydrogenase family)